MPTYFLSLKYKGTRYAGFQVQENAMTVQGEVEAAMRIYLKQDVQLTGSSRTDAGVHALKNFFHFAFEGELGRDFIYHTNAILPADIALTGVYKVPEGSHSRFDAVSRRYNYLIYKRKNPFIEDRSWFYPYPMDLALLQQAAALVLGEHDFTSFAKKRTQVHTHLCAISACHWKETVEGWSFTVEGNRFLRGMVRALVGTMVKVGRGKISVQAFEQILEARDSRLADFSAPAHGLFLEEVSYPDALSVFLH